MTRQWFRINLTRRSPASGMGSPVEGDVEHPVIVTRRKVDAARATGMETGDTRRSVSEVNLADVQQKSDRHATYGRIQNDGNRNYVKVDESPSPHLLWQWMQSWRRETRCPLTI